MSISPKISVILPAYNVQAFIKETIESILRQTYSDFELIVVDDGSNDDTVQVIDTFQDNRIVFVKNPKNMGIAYTLNRAISLAKAPLIARMDADDICKKTRLEKQFNMFIENPEIDVCGSWVQTFGLSNEVWQYPVENMEIKTKSLFSYPFANPSVMMKKKLFDNFSYNKTYEPAEDYFFYSEIFRDKVFYNIPEVLLYYRIHKSQSSTIHLEKRLNGAFNARKNILKTINVQDHGKLTLHDRIINSDLSDLDKISEWLLFLINQNSQTNFFDQSTFNNSVKSEWKLIVLKLLRVNNKHNISLFSLIKHTQENGLFTSKQQVLKFYLQAFLIKHFSSLYDILKKFK